MGNRARITHESLLHLIAARADETQAPNARWLHAEGWMLNPVSGVVPTDKANWRLVWRAPDEIDIRRRRAIEKAAAGLAQMYDVIW